MPGYIFTMDFEIYGITAEEAEKRSLALALYAQQTFSAEDVDIEVEQLFEAEVEPEPRSTHRKLVL